MATNAGSVETTVQGSSAHLFVPFSLGSDNTTTSDDATRPAAFLRLGAYSTVEDIAKQGSVDPLYFYPRQHVTDAGSANAFTQSAGDMSICSGGIALSCDGRMLLNASERFYLFSGGPMHVDTMDTLTVFAAKAISVTTDSTVKITTKKQSGTSDDDAQTANSITLDAAGKKGNVDIKAYKSTKEVAGNDYEYIDTDKYTYTQADTYAYKLGHAESVTLGDSFSFFMGATYTIKVSVEITIALASLILLYLMKFEVGLLKMDFQVWKMEMKEGNLQWSNLNAKAENLYVTTNGAKIAAAAVKKQDTAIKSVLNGVEWDGTVTLAKTGTAEVTIKAVVNVV